jgi:Mg2+ and Co2+ transporter CorA
MKTKVSKELKAIEVLGASVFESEALSKEQRTRASEYADRANALSYEVEEHHADYDASFVRMLSHTARMATYLSETLKKLGALHDQAAASLNDDWKPA